MYCKKHDCNLEPSVADPGEYICPGFMSIVMLMIEQNPGISQDEIVQKLEEDEYCQGEFWVRA